MRNIIECISLIYMYNAGAISSQTQELYKHQYKIIEYSNYCNLDRDAFSTLIPFDGVGEIV